MSPMANARAASPAQIPDAFPGTAYDGDHLEECLRSAATALLFDGNTSRQLVLASEHLRRVLDGCCGRTLQERWEEFEERVWPEWVAGRDRPPGKRWTGGVWVAVTARLVRPGWDFLRSAHHVRSWVERLPGHDPLAAQSAVLERAVASLGWPREEMRVAAHKLGLRLLLAQGYGSLEQITEQDLLSIPPSVQLGADALDAALCSLGVFSRTPLRANSRRGRVERLSPTELVEAATIPERFRPVTALYLESYAARVSHVYATLRHKVYSLSHFWCFLDERYPEVAGCAEVLPLHARAFVPHAIERGRRVRRGEAAREEDRLTPHTWLIDVRTFFADMCAWATEPGSPFAPHAPRTVPLTRRDLAGVGFEKARKQSQARLAATVLDLEREMPKVRAHALRRWSDAREALAGAPEDERLWAGEADAFWDWALLELLVQSGLRIEEASELTTLDVLKRRMPDGRVYYMLHIKPSKYGRGRVIPIGDGLGRVIAEIMRHVKRFYGTGSVPFCDHWDQHEKCSLPHAPYLLQGAGHPSPIGLQVIRSRLRKLSLAAGARNADGSPLALRPHDCRRVFASEHLNNNTPVHVIQALLGHATVDTVMVYAKLYPSHLVDEYRLAVRGAYGVLHGEESLRNPTAEEWAEFAAGCGLRDMGTHLCALPTGEHCPKGLVCLGCVHAQPKKSAAPVFRRMLISHERSLVTARSGGEPAGQIAAREMEVARIRHALRRAEELTEDVAAAIEEAAGAA